MTDLTFDQRVQRAFEVLLECVRLGLDDEACITAAKLALRETEADRG